MSTHLNFEGEKIEKKNLLYRQKTFMVSNSRPLTFKYRTRPAAPQLTAEVESSDAVHFPINRRSEHFVFICKALQVSSVPCNLEIKCRKHLVFRFRLLTVDVSEAGHQIALVCKTF